jgi:hypothetical protein
MKGRSIAVMADDQSGLSFLNSDQDLEEGEINDLEEGEIEEECGGLSEYHFSARDKRSGNENELQIRQSNSHYKSGNFTRNQRNPSRNTRYLRDRDERRTETRTSRGYEKSGRKRDSFKQNFSGKRRDDLLRGDKHRMRELGSSWEEDRILSRSLDNLIKMKVKLVTCLPSS